MNADTIKAFFTYATAFVVVVGGMAVIYFSRNDTASAQVQLLIGGFIGSALTFLFVQENSTRASRSAERQMNIGVTAGTPTTVTAETANVQGGDPTNVNVKGKDA